MRVVFMGTPDFAVGTLEALIEAGHQVIGVVTQPDKPKGRGKTLMPTPVKEVALKHQIPVYQPKKVREEEFTETLKKTGSGCDRSGGFRTDHHQRDPGNPQVRVH